jgi:hypothetical protein
MIRMALTTIVSLSLGAGLFACASREEIKAERAAQQVASDAEDDTACRDVGEPGSETYDKCRADKTAQRARQSEVDYRKARDFDRLLGGLDDL